MDKLKKSERIKWFDSLSKRDFENGAVRDEIRTALGQLDEAQFYIDWYKQYGEDHKAALEARVKELEKVFAEVSEQHQAMNESNIKLRARVTELEATVTKAAQDIISLEMQVDKLKKVLAWYGDEGNYQMRSYFATQGMEYFSDSYIMADKGHRARDVLK